MGLLTNQQIDEISQLVSTATGYSPNLRKIFLSSVNPKFKISLDRDDNDFYQLDLDLIKLNDTERLIDGTIPFEAWLVKAAKYLQPFPQANQAIQQALNDISTKMSNALPIQNIAPPTQKAIENIIKERIVHKNDMVSYAFLQGGWQAGISVARMQVSRYDNGILKQTAEGEPAIYLGTGWLLTKELILTNHHVINARNNNEPNASKGDFKLQAENTKVQFDFDADNMEGKIIKAVKLEAADLILDYAVLRLEKAVDRSPLTVLPERIQVTDGDPQVVNIIQHPFGYSKKVAIRNNHIYDSQYPKVRYFTDTEGGSSGSPVFNDNWQVIALHRASTLVNNVQYNGQTTAWVNEGVQLNAITEHIKLNFAALAAEIIGE